mmetsp:Transcript_26104/g.67163  ORF Transcript_26104/g.67163 Transcript_26104/m.67163 type:complete len:225 (+) Transcript_26104:603-1277(+)
MLSEAEPSPCSPCAHASIFSQLSGGRHRKACASGGHFPTYIGPAPEPTLTMRPPAGLSRGVKASQTRLGPSRLVLSTCSGLVWDWRPTPALFTTAYSLSPPSRSATSTAALPTDASSATSITTSSTDPPHPSGSAFAIAAAAASPRSALRAPISTRQPCSAANWRHSAAPIPALPPVTSTARAIASVTRLACLWMGCEFRKFSALADSGAKRETGGGEGPCIKI